MSARTVTIFAADVVGYSRLINGAEEETLHRLKDLHSVFDEHITRNGGRIFSMAGDAVQAEFGSAFEAMTAAWELQRSIRARNAGYALDQQMLYRIGLATGDVTDVQDVPYGLCIAIAGAMESLAHPGGVCVTKDVHDAVAGEKLWRFEPMGLVRPPAAPGGIEPFALILGAGGKQLQAGRVELPKVATDDGLRFKAAVVLFGLTLLLMVASLTYVLQHLDPKAGIEPKPTATANAEPTVGSQTKSPPQSLPTPVVNKSDTTAVTIPPPKPVSDAAPVSASVQPTPAAPAAVTSSAPSRAAPPLESAAPMKQPGLPAGVVPPEPAASPERAAAERKTEEIEACLGAPGQQTITACRLLLQSAGDLTVAARIGDIELRLGTALREAGRTEEAIEVLVRSNKDRPLASSLIQLGTARYEAGQLSAAIDDFSAALKLDPKDGEAYNNRAWVRYKARQFDDAASDARLAREYAGSKAYVWDTSGHINEALGRTEDAIGDFRKALSIDGQLTTSRAALSRLGVTP